MALVLRPTGLGDKAACVEAHREFEGGELGSWPFLLHWEPGLGWSSYLDLLDDPARVPDGLVPPRWTGSSWAGSPCASR